MDHRRRYVSDSVSTASPAQLLTMLYDRLVLDLQRAEAAQRAGSRAAAHDALVHAQDILMELRNTLDPGAWEGGPALAALYGYLHGELVRANVGGDVERIATCRSLVEPLRDAWRTAAASVPSGTAGATSA